MERTTDHYGSRKYKIQDTKYMSQKLRERAIPVHFVSGSRDPRSCLSSVFPVTKIN